MSAWWLAAARAVDSLVPDGLVGLDGEDWSLSRRVHCLDHMRRVLEQMQGAKVADGVSRPIDSLEVEAVMRLAVIPCGRCARCRLAAAHRVDLGPRAAALVCVQGMAWFPDPAVATPPGWRSARIAADSFVCAVQRARLDLALSLAHPNEQLDKRELLRRVAVLRARQEATWSMAAACAARALRWVAARDLGAAEALEVAWRGFLASRIEAGGVVYDTPLHVRDSLLSWRAN